MNRPSSLQLPEDLANRCLQLLVAAPQTAPLVRTGVPGDNPRGYFPAPNLPGSANAERLIPELWVRSGQCQSASFLTVQSPGRLSLVTGSLTSDAQYSEHTDELLENCACILDGQSLLRVTRPAQDDTIRSIHLWPEFLAALVLDHGEATRSASPTVARMMSVSELKTLTESLLRTATGSNLILPSDDKLAAMAEFAAGAGHEINNPLASIVGQTQLLLRNEPAIDRRQALETIGAQAWRIRDMIGNAMLFARHPAPRFEMVDLVAIAQETVRRFAEDQPDANVVIAFRSDETRVLIQADQSQLEAMLGHLIRNGVEAIRSQKGTGRVTVSIEPMSQIEAVHLIVEDSASGIQDDQIRAHLFDPFFSGRQAGRGLGFGLCIAWQIIRLHRGFIFCYSTPDSGASFHLGLPIEQPGTAATS